MGEAKTLRDVESARAALEKAYHNAGYMTVLVSIPEQEVVDGSVGLKVTEASVERLAVKGAEYTLPSEIRSRVPELAEGKVPNFPTMQAQLDELNRGGDLKVTPVLRAGKTPGTVDIELEVEDQPALHGSVDLNNRQTANTTASRIAVSLRYDNLFQKGHSFGLTAQTAPERTTDARVLAATYVLPTGSGGDALALYAVHSKSEFASLDAARDLGLLGNSDILGVRETLQLEKMGAYSHTLSFGADWKDIKQDILVQGAAGSNSPIRYMPVVASYNGMANGMEGSTALDLTTTLGLRGLPGNKDDAFDRKRPGASASFLALRGGVQHTENLGRWSVFGRFEGQLASGPLVPTEQFMAGGAESVRGYLEGETAGDAGHRLTLELRTPAWAVLGSTSPWSLSGLVFFDMARVYVKEPADYQAGSKALRGAGFGLRAKAPHGVSVELDLARALVEGDSTKAGEERVHARTLMAF
jgi:hemolysin activation/secretion protein